MHCNVLILQSKKIISILNECTLYFIDKYGSATRQEVDGLIMDKLPEILNQNQKRNKIANLLGSMKHLNLIENQGSDRKPRWFRRKI